MTPSQARFRDKNELLRALDERFLREPLIRMFFFRAATDTESFEDGLRFRRGVSARACDLLADRPEIRHPELDLLRFESMKDSVEEPEMAPPEELVQVLMQFLAGTRAPNVSDPPRAS